MRNFVPVLRTQIDSSEVTPLSLLDIKADGDQLFALFADEDQISIASYNGQWSEWAPFPASSKMVCFLAEIGTVVLVMANGDIIEATEDAATVVGSMPSHILAAEWSPDHEILCLVTSEKVLLLSRSYDFVGEHNLDPTDLSLSKHVSVGWGKKETQFQGRGTRAMRDPTMPEHVDSGQLQAEDVGEVAVSWRGDGEYVSVSSIDENRRVVRVFTRDGQLSSASEPVDLLGSPLSWQPIGAFIATATPSEIVFLERNGLRRSGFALSQPDVEQPPIALDWSSDSEVLAVSFTDRIELWYSKNWHWYRKQVLRHTQQGVHLIRARWHPERPRTLIVQWSDGSIDTHTFVWLTTECNGVVCVIDSNMIKITSLAKAAIPPPMAWKTLKLESQPCHVATDSTRVAVAFDSEIQVYEIETLKLVESLPVVGLCQQIQYADGQLRVLSTDPISGAQLLNGEMVNLPIVLIKSSGYLCADGTVYDYNHSLLASLGQICADIAIGSNRVFGLTATGQLLAADLEGTSVLGHNITSITMSGDLLMLTTPMFLKFIHASSVSVPVIPGDDVNNEQCREIDKGSVVVSVLQDKMAIVLQAPRGNIEMIYPRILCVGAVRKLILDGKYREAFVACRVHRIDMNILYDMNPQQFRSQLSKVIEDLGAANNIDLFLSNLSDEDITKTKYLDTSLAANDIHASSANKSTTVPGKVNDLCELLLPLIPIQSQLTALALKQPPELKRALDLAKTSGDESVKHLCFLVNAEKLYVTALELYDLKLALLIGQQAQMDPKEYLTFLREREKESIERRMFKIDDYLKKHEQALASLLKVPDASETEILTYVQSYGLHSKALELIGATVHESSLGREILASQAELWMAESRYADAGRNYEVLGMIPEATHAYTLSHEWQSALALDPSIEQASKCLDALVTHKKYGAAGDVCVLFTHEYRKAMEYFCEDGRYNDAVLVAKRHNIPGIEDCLRDRFGTLQELFSDCASQIPSQLRRIREIRKKRQEDSLNFAMLSINGEGVGEAAESMSIAGTESTAAPSYVTRYTDKTGGTAQTGASRRTQKNKRRDERKKARGKKGTVYEEDYLIASTGRLAERLSQSYAEAQQLVWCLRRLKLSMYAQQLVDTYERVIELLKAHMGEIYDVSDEDLVRFDELGEKFIAEKPVRPAIPPSLQL